MCQALFLTLGAYQWEKNSDRHGFNFLVVGDKQ